MLAADDEDRIVAVSDAGARLLGYDDAAELIGTRLVAIIPERYRQAHLAGFTMHFLSGRAPLIGRTVVVPALRSDGSEIEVELTIRTDRTEDGRTLFVADLDLSA
jgi:PAS domain S-box-containing protein